MEEIEVYNVLRHHKISLKKREEIIKDLMPLISNNEPSLTEIEKNNLKIVRNYFFEKDKTVHEHWCFSVLDVICDKIFKSE